MTSEISDVVTSETLVRGACRGSVQYAQPLTSSAPPSCTLVDSEREGAGAGVDPCPPGPCTRAGRHPCRGKYSRPRGASLAPPPRPRRVDQSHGSVSTALTSTTPPSTHAARIVGMLRFFPGAHRRCRVDVSTMDTDTPSRLVPSTPPSPPEPPARPSSRPSECLRSHDTQTSQK